MGEDELGEGKAESMSKPGRQERVTCSRSCYERIQDSNE